MNIILSLPDVIYTIPLSSPDEQKETSKENKLIYFFKWAA